MMELHSLLSVAYGGDGSFMVEADITDIAGERYIAEYRLVPGDEFGLAPTIRQAVEDWIDAGNAPAPYVPLPKPGSEELRAAMPPVSARQLRRGLISRGIALAEVQAAVDAITDPVAREMAQVDWEYTTEFERQYPLIEVISAALGLSPEEVDDMWLEAQSLQG